jgi:Zn-dependent metalloprotease
MLGTLAASTAQAQEAPRIQNKVHGADNQPELIEFDAVGKPSYKAPGAVTVLREHLALAADDQLRPSRTETDELGFSHQKFAHYFKGVKTEHASYSRHARGGAVESISDDFTDSGELVASGSSTLSSTFTVPSTAKTGSTCLRVIVSDTSGTASCNSYSETEDYTVGITGGPGLTRFAGPLARAHRPRRLAGQRAGPRAGSVP